MKKWKLIGFGSFNEAYLNKAEGCVLKIQKKVENQSPIARRLDSRKRSIRLWNQINEHIFPKAKSVRIRKYHIKAWTCPYIQGRQSSDIEISEALINIYNRTGRIVIDAGSHKNFITTPHGQVICVDVGQAFLLDKIDHESTIPTAGRTRRHSITSLNAWETLYSEFVNYLNRESLNERYPLSINTIKALLFIKFNYPEILDVSFMNAQLPLIYRLAFAFDTDEPAITFDPEALIHGELRERKKVRRGFRAHHMVDIPEHNVSFVDGVAPPIPSDYNESTSRASLFSGLGLFADAISVAPTHCPDSDIAIDDTSGRADLASFLTVL
jgi:hypothetical protein